MKIRTLFTVIALTLALPAMQAAQPSVTADVAAQIKANPANAAQIVADAIKANPALAPDIAAAAVKAAPSQAKAITTAAIKAAPDQILAIAKAESKAVPAQGNNIYAAAVAEAISGASQNGNARSVSGQVSALVDILVQSMVDRRGSSSSDTGDSDTGINKVSATTVSVSQ